MVSYRFVPISSQKGVLFFETPGMVGISCHVISKNFQKEAVS